MFFLISYNCLALSKIWVNLPYREMIETERLILKPLTYDHLMKYMRSDNSLEEDLQLNATSRAISDELREALEYSIIPNVSDTSKNYLFSTLWTIILKSENKMVGDLCFVGEPNPEGEITIGYGLYESFRKQGFMAEAVKGIISWASQQPYVKSIIAETDIDNVDSSSILLKNNFVIIGADEMIYKWQLIITCN